VLGYVSGGTAMATSVQTGHLVRDSDAVAEPITGRLVRGAVGGLVAGAAFIAVTMWFATSVGDPARGPLRMISTIVLGDDAMASGDADVTIGIVVHAVLSAGFGVLFAFVAPVFRTNGTIAVAGSVYGGLLYLVNFKVLSPAAFETFEMANQPFEVVVHILYGTILVWFFYSSGARSHEPLLAIGMR